jgi:SAM-dependent methyltransferase
LPEFTGERVIPGLVDADLFNEHLARYRFAARFAGATALDIGCGTGYGTRGVGIDVSHEALTYARAHFPGARFVQASAEKLPFDAETFDLVTAFEVIEHLERWPDLLAEANRVLKPQGVLLVSTPNKAYYAEMRAKTGPNPFHVHEFEHADFEAALYGMFPHVRIWAQNHADAIVFAPLNPGAAALEANGDPHPENAHFFIAACSRSAVEHADLYAWMPATANVLRERERHIARLEGELAQKDEWLARLKDDHAALHRAHQAALADVKERSLWAMQVERDLEQRNRRIDELQDEAAQRLAWVRDIEARLTTAVSEAARLEAEVENRTTWARSIEEQLETRTRHVQILKDELEGYKHAWSVSQEEIATAHQSIEALEAKLALIAQSKWIHLGRSLKVGPVVNE